ncbi:hypothetical protein DFH06DRAFT_1434769 [Mycena polygramma]|nr:hypothetical protein DFH06DRAFT_1434769 [Mycena polygramma]
MGTPKLWSKIVVDTAHWAKASLSPAKLLSLLSSSLKRSENHPLTLEVGVSQTDPEPHAVIDLLSRHVQRWKDVYFWSDSEPGPHLAAKGKLDSLENLYISADWKSVVGAWTSSRSPRGWRRSNFVETSRWYPTFHGTKFAHSRRCPNIRTFVFQLAFPDLPAGTTMASVASDVETLTFELDRVGNISRPQDTRTANGSRWPRRVNLGLPPMWDTDSFLSLADRSSFHGHLTDLEIDALITDQEFLRSVAVLPVLKKLFISDCTASDSHVVITDTLLQGLIRKGSGTTVVAQLEFLSLTSRLRFTDSIYRDLITSRLPVNIEDSFETHILSLPDRRRELPLELLSGVSDLECAGILFQVGSRLSLNAFFRLSYAGRVLQALQALYNPMFVSRLCPTYWQSSSSALQAMNIPHSQRRDHVSGRAKDDLEKKKETGSTLHAPAPSRTGPSGYSCLVAQFLADARRALQAVYTYRSTSESQLRASNSTRRQFPGQPAELSFDFWSQFVRKTKNKNPVYEPMRLPRVERGPSACTVKTTMFYQLQQMHAACYRRCIPRLLTNNETVMFHSFDVARLRTCPGLDKVVNGHGANGNQSASSKTSCPILWLAGCPFLPFKPKSAWQFANSSDLPAPAASQLRPTWSSATPLAANIP